jgi:hypothetical protein
MTTKTQREEKSSTLLKLLGKANEWNLPVTVLSVSNDLNWLHRQEMTLHRLSEKQCNDESWGIKDEKKRDAIEARVRIMLSLYHIPVRFNNDPRMNVPCLNYQTQRLVNTTDLRG